MLICPFLNNLLWTSLIPTTYKWTTKARAFELQWTILDFVSSIGIIVGTFIGEAWLDEEEAKFKEIQWDYHFPVQPLRSVTLISFVFFFKPQNMWDKVEEKTTPMTLTAEETDSE